MLRFKNLLHASEEELALRKVISLLLEKIGTVAVKGTGDDYVDFCSEMNQFRDHIWNETSPEQLSISSNAVVQAMETYNLRIAALLRKQSSELQSVISMVTETAHKLGGESSRSAHRLQEIGNKFEKAGSVEDLRALKAHLSECLNGFRDEVQRQRSESEAAIRALQRQVELGTGAAPVAVSLQNPPDPTTGLPRKDDALAAMQTASESGKRLYVVTLVVKGVQSVNARFGFEIGDRMLRSFKDNVEKHLSRADRLFRWDGPAIVVLMDRPEPVGQVRAQIRRLLDSHLEENFKVDGRSVLLPITADFLIFPLMPPAATAIKQIHAFVAGQGPVTSAA